MIGLICKYIFNKCSVSIFMAFISLSESWSMTMSSIVNSFLVSGIEGLIIEQSEELSS